MALSDMPGKCVWARSPEGKESQFGLFVYAPEDTGKFEYPQIGLAVIKKSDTAPCGWVPWMAEPKKQSRYNPRVFCYVDTIPQLLDVLTQILRKHRPGQKISDDQGRVMRRTMENAKAEDQLGADIQKFHEFG